MIRTLLISGLLIVLFACSKSDFLVEDLISGEWINDIENNDGQIQRLSYIFNNGAFETKSVTLQEGTLELLGYRYLAKGNYSIRKNDLTFQYLEARAILEGPHPFLELHQLGETDLPNDYTVEMKFSKDGNTLELVFEPCAYNQNCILSLELKRG